MPLFNGKITVTSQRLSLSVAQSFQAGADLNSWFDSGADLNALFGALIASSDANIVLACKNVGSDSETFNGYGMVVANAAALYAYNRANRSNVPLLFLLGGQSNMSGRGLTSDLPSPFPVVPSQCVSFGNDYQWHAPAAEPVDSNVGQVDSVSSDQSGVACGLATIDRITDPSHGNRANQCALIPCSMSSTMISQWQPGNNHEDRTTLYGSMLHRARVVTQQLGAPLGAFIWYQGETDALNGTATATYQAAVQAMFDALRADLGQPALPIFVVQLPPTVPSGFGANWAGIRTAQAASAAAHTFVISAPDGPWTDSTNLHLATAAQLVLGAAVGDAYLANVR